MDVFEDGWLLKDSVFSTVGPIIIFTAFVSVCCWFVKLTLSLIFLVNFKLYS
uniref:Uncharacterized protein n=1 Tax=Rhizophora mucronata TaxID=61149 RepID=A0A2P2Q931_RHIMU